MKNSCCKGCKWEWGSKLEVFLRFLCGKGRSQLGQEDEGVWNYSASKIDCWHGNHNLELGLNLNIAKCFDIFYDLQWSSAKWKRFWIFGVLAPRQFNEVKATN
jgi:hypothetical protein